MEQIRRQYANDIRAEIIHVEKAQQRDNESVFGLRNLAKTYSKEILDLKRIELQDNMKERGERLDALIAREKDTLKGRYDDEINEELKTHRDAVDSRDAFLGKRKQERLDDKNEKKKRMDVAFKAQKYEKASVKDCSYFNRRFEQIGDSLPENMINNLRDMPNNKGYIWKGCWFLGNLNKEYGQPQIMFEKLRGGVLRIHEYTSTEYRLYEKKGADKKILISRKKRKVFN